MDRRTFLKCAGAGALGAIGSVAGWTRTWAAGGGTEKTPNVVLVLIDDQGFGDLGYHGKPQSPRRGTVYARPAPSFLRSSMARMPANGKEALAR